MASQELARTQPSAGQALAVHGDDDRALDRLMARARIIAKVPGLKKEIAGNADAVAGIMLSLNAYGLPATIPGINGAFDWIEGKAEMSARTYQALAYKNGYDIDPTVRTAELARATITNMRTGRSKVVEFTLDDARRAHRLDEWVEKWESNGGKWKLAARLVIRVDGQPVNEPWPDWVHTQISGGRVKSYEAWWNYRTDMLWKAAAKRAVIVACPHVLLGATEETDHDLAWPDPATDDVEAVDVGDWEPTPDPDDLEYLDGIDDAEIIPPSPRPASPPPPEGEAEPATTARDGQEGPAPAEEPATAHRYTNPDEEPF